MHSNYYKKIVISNIICILIDRNLNKNRRQNLCWGTRSMPILNEQGDLNVEVLETLIKFYLQPPTPIDVSQTSTGEITPYLTAKLSDLDVVEREFTFVNVSEMYRQKNIHQSKKPFPEMYDWERIYKVN